MWTQVAVPQVQSSGNVSVMRLMQGSLGLAGYKILITGASDRTGIAAKKGIPGAGRRKLLLAGGIGFHPVMDGERRRKTIRSSEITQDFVQINAQVTTYGEKTLDETLPESRG